VHDVSLARDAPPIKRREGLAPPRLFTHLRAAQEAAHFVPLQG